MEYKIRNKQTGKVYETEQEIKDLVSHLMDNRNRMFFAQMLLGAHDELEIITEEQLDQEEMDEARGYNPTETHFDDVYGIPVVVTPFKEEKSQVPRWPK